MEGSAHGDAIAGFRQLPCRDACGGRVRSHGSVNLGSTDARWLFYWTTPHLPETWHGVFSQETSPGTMVVVRP